MWTVENLSNEDSSHCGDHNDNRDGNKNGSNCERMSEEELERGERFFLSNGRNKGDKDNDGAPKGRTSTTVHNRATNEK
jgi:hypothetical protein